jgi:hypothetical protein
MCSRITHLSEQYAGRRPAEIKKVDKAGKTVRPSTQDKKATVDELKYFFCHHYPYFVSPCC